MSSRSLIALALLVVALLVGAAAILILAEAPPSSPTDSQDPAPSNSSTGSTGIGRIEAEAKRERLSSPTAVEELSPRPHKEPSHAFASVTLLARWEEEKEPISNLDLRILFVGGDLHIQTDFQGQLRLQDLRPGRITVHSSLGSWQDYELHPGDNEIEYLLPEGMTLVGRVIDGSGFPVARAGIWLGPDGTSIQGQTVTYTRQDGTFRLRCAETDICVGAHAKGWAPTLRYFFEGQPGDTLETEFLLENPGGRVEGQVITPQGQPIQGARLMIGSGRVRTMVDREGSEGNLASTRYLRSDDQGQFRLEGLPIGSFPIAARATGWAPWSGEVSVSKDSFEFQTITLSLGATVFGQITDEQGNGVPGIIRRDIRRRPQFFRQVTRADEDGHYRLTHVPSGSLQLIASASGVSLERSFDIQEGESYEWNPSLLGPKTIQGRLTSEEKTPLAGWRITAPFTTGWVKTDSNGHFELTMKENRSTNVKAYRADISAPAAYTWPQMAPSSERQEFVIPLRQLPKAQIVGRVEDAEGRVPRKAKVRILSPDLEEQWATSLDQESGRFRFGPAPPGTYQLRLDNEGAPTFDLGEVELMAQEERDLGVIRIPRQGRVQVNLTPRSLVDELMKDSEDLSNVLSLDLYRDGHFVTRVAVNGSVPVYEGSYELRVQGDVKEQTLSVHVERDKDVTLEVNLEKAVRQWIRITVARAHDPPPKSVRVKVLSRQGNTVQERTLAISQKRIEQVRHARNGESVLLGWLAFALDPGTYRIEALSDSDLKAHTEVSLSFEERPPSQIMILSQ